MWNFRDVTDVFDFDPGSTYGPDVILQIQSNRTSLEGLFIDKVLKILGLKRPSKFYPPKSNRELRSLHQAVVEGSQEEHHRVSILSVLYYIILDVDSSTRRREASEQFEQRYFLPPKYQIQMKGLWHLDRLEFQDALEYLTHPSITPTFPDEILSVLVRHSKSDDLTPALAYYHTAQPALTDQIALESLFSAIARANVTEAFYFTRGQAEYARRRMFEMLVSLALSHFPTTATADRSTELVNLPLTLQEEGWLEEYVLRGEGRGLQNGKATLMMRQMGTGKFDKVVKAKGMNSRVIGGMDWSRLVESAQRGLGYRMS